jgi:hypothetical protein
MPKSYRLRLRKNSRKHISRKTYRKKSLMKKQKYRKNSVVKKSRQKGGAEGGHAPAWVNADDVPGWDPLMGSLKMSDNQLKKYHTQRNNKQNAPQKIIKLQTRVTSLEQLQKVLKDRVDKLEKSDNGNSSPGNKFLDF